MPYKREIARKSKRVISKNLRDYLLIGKLSQDSDVFRLSGDHKSLCRVWDTVKKEILLPFIKANPCRRPFAFWLCASEPRKQIGGLGDGWSPGMATDSDGLPKYWQLEWDKKNPPTFESEAAYLERHGFLTPVERGFLEKNPELMELERIEFKED